MKTSKTIPMIVAAALAATLAGCGKPAMPEVNDANCTLDNIKKIEDQAVRQQFAHLCAVRPTDPKAGEFKPSKPRNW